MLSSQVAVSVPSANLSGRILFARAQQALVDAHAAMARKNHAVRGAQWRRLRALQQLVLTEKQRVGHRQGTI